MLRNSLFLTLACVFLTLSSAFSQTPVRGKVRDAETGKPLEFANVALLNPQDSTMITGAMTNGDFEFTADPGSYILRIGFIGYDQLFRELEVTVSA